MQKFLVIRFSSIGDIVLTSPIISAIKQMPNTEVHFITKKKFSSVIENNPNIDKLYTFEKEITEIISDLRKEKYDILIDLHHNLRSLRLAKMLGVKRLKFDKLNSKKWLMVNFKINLLPKKHIVDRYFDTLEMLNIQSTKKGLEYYLTKEEEQIAIDFKTKLNSDYLVFVIGGAHFTKQIPLSLFEAIIPHIKLPIVLLGGKEDQYKATKICEGHNHPIYNYCGKLKLNESAAMIKYAAKVLTSDTGLMHIAACFNKPIYSVWGNTVPDFGMYPYFDKNNKHHNHIFEVENLSCRPCSKIGFAECPKSHFNCMTKQDVRKIIDGLNL